MQRGGSRSSPMRTTSMSARSMSDNIIHYLVKKIFMRKGIKKNGDRSKERIKH